MQVKIFSFNKVDKSPINVENKINELLTDSAFKFASQSESITKGKFIISIFYEPNKKSNVRVKAFRNDDVKEVQSKVNEFLETGVDMKFCTQSSSTANIYCLVFFESKKVKDDSTEAK